MISDILMQKVLVDEPATIKIDVSPLEANAFLSSPRRNSFVLQWIF